MAGFFGRHAIAACRERGGEVRESPMHDHGVDREAEEPLLTGR